MEGKLWTHDVYYAWYVKCRRLVQLKRVAVVAVPVLLLVAALSVLGKSTVTIDGSDLLLISSAGAVYTVLLRGRGRDACLLRTIRSRFAAGR